MIGGNSWQNSSIWIRENEFEDTTAAVLMVDKYGGKDTPGKLRVKTSKKKIAWWVQRGRNVRRNRAMSLLCHLLCAMHYLMYQPAMPDTANHASTRRQARTDGGGGGEKESSVPELCVCGQACVYRHIARCVFTTIFINLNTVKISYSCMPNMSAFISGHNKRILEQPKPDLPWYCRVKLNCPLGGKC